MANKLKVIYRISKGYVYKWLTDIGYYKPCKLEPRDADGANEKIIVTLTSYGRRVDKVVYYTLISLLRQSLAPDKIVVCLDKKRHSQENLPKRLIKLMDYGVEYIFCEDIRSYKKLIPSLKKYPEDILITVDDDVIYRRDIVESLVNAHNDDQKAIVTNQCRFPIIKDDKFLPYNQWVSPNSTPENICAIMPIGVSGVLYPPGSLDPEVFNQEVFQKLCPLADDIWFWLMAKLNGTNHIVIAQEKSVGNSFDDLYQYFHKGSALTHSNSKQNANDRQLMDLLEYYHIDLSTLLQSSEP